MSKLIYVAFVLLVLVVSGCSGTAGEQPTPVPLEATPTPKPLSKPAFEDVRNVFNSSQANTLVGTAVSDWVGWVVEKSDTRHADSYPDRSPNWVRLTVVDPYFEELLPEGANPYSPLSSGADATAEARQGGFSMVLDGLTAEQYDKLHYGQDVIFGGKIVTVDGYQLLLRDVKVQPVQNSVRATPTINSPDDVVIRLARDFCFGTCPVYSITIKGDGWVSYQGNAFVATCGLAASLISKAQVMELVALFQRASYFDLRDNYTAAYVTDNPYYRTSLTLNGTTKTINHYAADPTSPTKLSILEDRIDEVVNSSQWIGDVGYPGGPCATPTP